MTRKNRVFICVFTFLVIFLISFGLSDKTETRYKTIERTEPSVFVTVSGECYHSSDCYYLRYSAKEIGLYKAKSMGFRACSYCYGENEGTTQVEYTQAYEKDNTLYVFMSCLGISMAVAGCIYFILGKLQ